MPADRQQQHIRSIPAAEKSVAPPPELQLSLLAEETLVWHKGPVIGSGRFGIVHLALRVPSGEQLAVKQIFIQEELAQGNDVSSLSLQRVLSIGQIERETAILSALDHPNVVRYLGWERYGPTAHIFMEYAHVGSLSKLLRDFGPFDEPAIRSYTRQLLCGVAYLHAQRIAHRDLKCANLLLSDDGTLKIADFGTAKRARDCGDDGDDGLSPQRQQQQQQRLETARSVRDGLGSPYWMAPELVRAEKGEDSWRKADIWGVGCVVIEMATAKPPWENHSNPLTAMFHIASDDALPRLPDSLSDVAKDFLMLCLVKNPSLRPSAAELLRHPFVSVGEPATAILVQSNISTTMLGESISARKAEAGSEAKDESDEGSCASFSSSSSPSPLTSDEEEEHSAEYSSSEEDGATGA